MTQKTYNDPNADELVFLDEEGDRDTLPPFCWKVLVVDDEPDVHQATELALSGVVIEGRPLCFLHAATGEAACQLLMDEPDIAVILLDVVMETSDAGLGVVRFVREKLGNRATRIILRTGQPGYAPEIDTIRDYDINDYKTKTELTRVRLFTSLTVGIRAYAQLIQVETSRRGLGKIVEACAELSQLTGIEHFAEGVVTQLCGLLGIPDEGVVCAAGLLDTQGAPGPFILAAAGRYSAWIGLPLCEVPDSRVKALLQSSLSSRSHHYGETTCLFFAAPQGRELAAFVDVKAPIHEFNRNLLEVFSANISVAFENAVLLQRISDLAYEDALLKMPNRNSLLHHLDTQAEGGMTLALVDLDSFSDINSILDQEFGDDTLRAVAARLCQQFEGANVVARVGSDVFGILGPAHLVTAHAIDAVFASPLRVGQESLRLSATTGLLPLSGAMHKGLAHLKNASVALKQAKALARGRALEFEENYATVARERMQMLNRLRLAFSLQRLVLTYQPVIDLESQRVVGAEALLRWPLGEGAFIPPTQFIPLAEQSGLMVPIGDWVLHSALEFLKQLTVAGFADFRMAVNVSQVQFREPDFVEKLLRAISDHGVDPANVEIELTESVAIDNIDLIERKLSAVKAAGVTVAIDDFGTGYSSLNLLRQLAVDRLKVDRAFVSGAEGVGQGVSLAEAVLALAARFGLKTVAEGIETPAQFAALRQMGCLDGQGYLFSRPLLKEAFREYLLKQGS